MRLPQSSFAVGQQKSSTVIVSLKIKCINWKMDRQKLLPTRKTQKKQVRSTTKEGVQ